LQQHDVERAGVDRQDLGSGLIVHVLWDLTRYGGSQLQHLHTVYAITDFDLEYDLDPVHLPYISAYKTHIIYTMLTLLGKIITSK
jgi:hypothetical protein